MFLFRYAPQKLNTFGDAYFYGKKKEKWGVDKIRVLCYNKEEHKELKSIKKITVDENR